MMKIVGIVMIAISIVLIGYLYYIKVKQRPAELSFFIKLLSVYESELKWNQKSITEVLDTFSYPEFEDYISKTISLLKENDYVYSFMNGNENFEKFHLSSDDIKVLKNFFVQTGYSGLEGEINMCKKTIDILETLKLEAETKYKKLGPLAVKLSVICGIWIIILLF